jgi:tetratricopeptide (TPR) repeat protein
MGKNQKCALQIQGKSIVWGRGKRLSIFSLKNPLVQIRAGSLLAAFNKKICATGTSSIALIFFILGFYFVTDKEKALANSDLQNPQALEQQAQSLYERGRLPDAISLLQQAITKYRSQGDVIGEAIALRNLALVYQQLGDWKQAEKTIADAIKSLPEITEEIEYRRLLAQALDVRGQIQLSLSRSQQALDTWKQAAQIYQNISDIAGFTRSKIYQATALQTLGLYAQAIDSLTEIQQQLKTESDSLVKSKALLNLGDVLRRVGKNEEAKLALQESLKIAENLQSKQAIADALLSLGNTARIEKNNRDALAYYRRAIEVSPLPDTRLQGQLDILSLLIQNQTRSEITATVTEIENLLTQLSPSKTRANASKSCNPCPARVTFSSNKTK